MVHDFKEFPELTNNQLQIYYWESPHKQITEDIRARVVKVHDGDTVTVRWEDRDFDFPVRLSDLAAPEMNEPNGAKSRDWLKGEVLGKEVDVILSKRRTEKWGRLLADIVVGGISMSEEAVRTGNGVPWSDRTEGVVPHQTKLIPFIK